jgi:hypothetical protein
MPDYFAAPTQPAGPLAPEKVTQNAYFHPGNVILETVDVTKLARTCSATEVAQIMGKRPAKATLRGPRVLLCSCLNCRLRGRLLHFATPEPYIRKFHSYY